MRPIIIPPLVPSVVLIALSLTSLVAGGDGCDGLAPVSCDHWKVTSWVSDSPPYDGPCMNANALANSDPGKIDCKGNLFFSSVAFANRPGWDRGHFVAISNDKTVMSNLYGGDDGSTWHTYGLPKKVLRGSTWSHVACSDEAVAGSAVCVAVATSTCGDCDPTHRVMRTAVNDTGMDWQPVSVPEVSWNYIMYAKGHGASGTFVALSTSHKRIMISQDLGLTWLVKEFHGRAQDNDWTAGYYKDGMYVFVAESGDRRVTRESAADMENPNSQFGHGWQVSTCEDCKWSGITYGSNRWVATAFHNSYQCGNNAKDTHMMGTADAQEWYGYTRSTWAGGHLKAKDIVYSAARNVYMIAGVGQPKLSYDGGFTFCPVGISMGANYRHMAINERGTHFILVGFSGGDDRMQRIYY